jgi:hypothetical protein
MNEVQRHPQAIDFYFFHRKSSGFFLPLDEVTDRYIAGPELILLLRKLVGR